MTLLSGIGILLSLVFGCLLLALVAELYYLLWWKKQRISNNSNQIEEDYSNHTQELFYLFCWDKPSDVTNPSSNPTLVNLNPDGNLHDPDVELGLGSSKDVLLKSFGEESVESELMRLHNLAGPPRFLFTIKEETKEDLESDDGKSKGERSIKRSRTRSLSDLIMTLENQTPYLSPLGSPPLKALSNNNNYNNPLFESSFEGEFHRLRSCSPPPKFKFLRDAEEKLCRKLREEAMKKKKSMNNNSNNNQGSNCLEEDNKEGDLMKGKSGNFGKNKERETSHCSSQVLPLVSSPNENKQNLHC